MGHPMGKSKKQGRGKEDFYYRKTKKKGEEFTEQPIDTEEEILYIEEDHDQD